jgi:hypothetical protein
MKEQKTISKLMDNWQSLVGMPKLLNTGSNTNKLTLNQINKQDKFRSNVNQIQPNQQSNQQSHQ